MKIAALTVCSVLVCLAFANTAQSFHLAKKLADVKGPIIAAKVNFANDVKVKAVAVAGKALLLKKKAAIAIATPFVAIKAWKKKLLAKKLAKIAGPIIALKSLKRAIIEKKMNTLASIIPAAAGLGLGGLTRSSEGYTFSQWNGVPYEPNDANSFVLVPEEYTSYHVEDSAAPRTFGPSGDFVRSTLSGAESTLETLGNHVPFLHTLSNGISSFKQSLHPKPVYQFVPNLGFHQYSNVHYEPSVPVVVPTVPEAEETPSYFVEDTPQETYGPPKPYPPAPEEPHEEYGVPSTTLAPPSPTYGPPPHPTYGPPPPQTYGPPPPETYGLPNTYSSSSFQIPKTSYGVPAGPSYHLTQRF